MSFNKLPISVCILVDQPLDNLPHSQEPAVHAQRIHRMIKLGLGIDEADEEVRVYLVLSGMFRTGCFFNWCPPKSSQVSDYIINPIKSSKCQNLLTKKN